MAAKSKTELLETTKREFEKLIALITPLEADGALQKVDEDASIKDVIAHRAQWIDLFLGWYTDGLAGHIVYFPAEGYKWSDLKRYNADLRQAQSNLDWAEAVEMLNANHNKLVAFIKGCGDADLYAWPMKGANNAWKPGRWAEAAGASHFRSASKFVRATLRKLT